jgi:hypothetical protein
MFDIIDTENDSYTGNDSIERKTTITTPVTPAVVQSNNVNVLNSYRSYTYNFTLAGLKKDRVNDPESYRNSELDLVIAKSGGKGTQGISSVGTNKVSTQNTQIVAGDPAQGTNASKNIELDSVANKLIQSFNQESPGRFDLFIDNVDIDTLMAFNARSGSTLASSIKFEIFEPYSINGFIESLHVAAVAAGYVTYSNASFVLKMEFWGYPDNVDLGTPVKIPKTERYFVFAFQGVEVDITEQGTRYRCVGIPFQEKGFGQPSQLTAPVKMAGNTVEEILKNLMSDVTAQVKESEEKARKSQGTPGYDTYSIEFPAVNSAGGSDKTDKSKVNAIASAKIIEVGKESAVYQHPEQGEPSALSSTDQPSATVRYNPQTSTIQFHEGKKIEECIEQVIRDSRYVRDILETLDKKIDSNGMVPYFLIKLEVTNQDKIDDIKKRPYQNFKFVVTEYKVHFTKIPNYAQSKIDFSRLKKLSLREYNYIYTGKNVDVLNFKLNFNTLFFEAIPRGLGNNNSPSATDSIGNNNSPGAQLSPVALTTTAKDLTSSRGSYPTAEAVAIMRDGGSANQIQDDPYFVLARNMHNAIINSKTGLITGELEIVGDPFYIATGGIGNYNPLPVDGQEGVTSTGEVAHNYREVLITINFRNPIDIKPLNEGGRAYFQSTKVPFSGIYQVTQVASTFRGGNFKQTLSVIRIPGQIFTNDISPTDYKTIQVPYDDPENDVMTISQEDAAPTVRANELSIFSTIGRGLPNPGLPGQLSNFISSAAGLGGTVNSLLSQVSGAVTNGIGKLTSAAGVFGGSIPGGVDQLASGIRLQTAGLINLSQTNLESVALIGQAANTVQGQFPVVNAVKALSSDIATRASNLSQLTAFPGSGIGQGATISLNGLADSQSSLIAQGVESAKKLANELGSNIESTVSRIGNQAAGLVNGVADKVSALTSINSLDPTNLAGKFGINVGQLSGLSSALQSKVLGQLSDLAGKIPANVDLSAATSQGLVLDYVSGDNLANIPAISPNTTAPPPAPDRAFLSTLDSPRALARAFGVSDVSEISQSLLPTDVLNNLLTTMPATVGNPLASVSNGMVNAIASGDKILSAGQQLSSVTGIRGSVEGVLSSVKDTVGSTLNIGGNLSATVTETFGSKTKGTSPLDRIMLSAVDRLPGTGKS